MNLGKLTDKSLLVSFPEDIRIDYFSFSFAAASAYGLVR